MQPLKGLVWGCALAALAALANPAHAGWNNVFQVCCNSCGGHSAPAVSAYADPCCTPPPTCTTRYIQRTYYQPVTTYQTSTYYQPVTTYKTSYYYEPVCSYRYSCYYDPCTCSYQQVAVPTTSYRLRSQCCPVTSYLQRCCMKPVTTYRAMCYYEPVTTCCQPQPACCPTGAAPPGPGGNAVPAPAPGTEERTGGSDRFLPGPPPGTKESSDAPPMNPASPSRRRTTTEKAPSPKYSGPHFASLERDSHTVAGRLVDGDRKALSSARVLFVNVERKSNQHTATTDAGGSFKANLGEGAWLVYTYDNAGKPVFSRRVEVPAGRTVQLTLVNR